MKILCAPDSRLSTERFAAICLIVTVLSQLLLRSMYLGNGPLNVDESFFAACGVRALVENSAPLFACLDNKPPGVFFLYQLIFSVFGPYNMFAVHLAGMLWVFATAIAVFMASRELSGRTAACWAAIFYLVLSSGNERLLAVKTELLAALPLSMSFWLFALSFRTHSKVGMFGAGALLAGAVLFKQPSVLAFGSIGLVLLVSAMSSGSWKRSAINGLSFLVGLTSTIALLALAYWLANGWDDLFYQTVQYPSQYATVKSESLARRLIRLVSSTEEYSRLAPYCWLAAILGCVIKDDQRPPATPGAHVLPIRIWFASTIAVMLAAVSLGREFYLAYYIFTFPALALAGGRFMQIGLEASGGFRISVCLLGSLVIASSTIMLGKYPMKRWMSNEPPSVLSETAQRIKALSTKGDGLYVWGYAPDLYIATRLVGASKVLLSDHLQGLYAEYTPGLKAADRMHLVRPENWHKFMSDLEKNKPRFIVDISGRSLKEGEAITFSPDNYPRFIAYLQTHCYVDSVDRGTKLYVCGDGRLAKPLSRAGG